MKVPLLERAFALVMIAFLAPLMLFTAVVQWVTSGRPLFYTSKRLGCCGEVFTVYKFRSMINDRKLIERVIKSKNERTGTVLHNFELDSPVYTSWGRVMEATQLVELPQLFNVARGEMSIVGNRPLPLSISEALKERYGSLAYGRMAVAPGLAGVVQLIGKDTLTDEERLILEKKFADRILALSHAPFIQFYFKITILIVTVIHVLTRGKFFLFSEWILNGSR